MCRPPQRAVTAATSVGNGLRLQQVGSKNDRRICALGVQFGGQGLRGSLRIAVVNRNCCTGGVQMLYDFRAHPPRAAGDQRGLTGKCECLGTHISSL